MTITTRISNFTDSFPNPGTLSSHNAADMDSQTLDGMKVCMCMDEMAESLVKNGDAL